MTYRPKQYLVCIFVLLSLFGCTDPTLVSVQQVNNQLPPLPAGVYESDNVDSVPVVKDRAPVQYPLSLRASGIQGKALIVFIVRANGCVDTVTVLRATDIRLGQAAADAVSRSTFKPARVKGIPVSCRAPMLFNFALDSNN